MERLLDPKNDWAFKQVFGQEKNKAILIHFLNDMLDEHVLHGDRITNVMFLRVDLDTEIALLRQSIVDVLCKTKNGTHFIIEMQKASDSESFTLLTYKDLVRFKKSNILRKRWN